MERADYERLRWRCVRRALLELDITLTRFLDQGFEQHLWPLSASASLVLAHAAMSDALHAAITLLAAKLGAAIWWTSGAGQLRLWTGLITTFTGLRIGQSAAADLPRRRRGRPRGWPVAMWPGERRIFLRRGRNWAMQPMPRPLSVGGA